MNCTHCDRDNPADAAFCSGCGQRLQVVCRGCSRPNASDAAFCNGCGRPLEEGAEPPAPVPERNPQDYTPKHLADKILTTKSVLEGESKVVSVLFVDLQGSMELSEGIDPEEWHAILDRFFGILADGVHRYEGTVNQYTGDGIMALFGAPITHEDHAQRACYAALQLRSDLREYAQELKRDRGLTFSVRMGINSGNVVVGKIGDDLRMDYTAQGHSVGLAARMQQLASPDTVYLTEHTAALVAGYFELGDLGSFNVKGVSEPVVAHELQGLGRLRTRLDASRARGFSKFVGRAPEMDALERALENAASGHGQVVGVVADAGTGKSRLCFEFLEGCRAKGIPIYCGTGVAHGKAIPFLPILELFRNYFGITEHDSDEACREKIAGRLLLIDESFRNSLPMVFDFLGVPDPANPAQRMDPDAWKRQFYTLVKRVTQERGQKELSITLLEDLHWFDDGSEGFLEPMVEATPTARNLLLVNFRPEYHSDWMGHSYYQQLPLLPLGADAIRELLDDLLGTDPSLAGLADRIHERTTGNPFFIEEVIQSLVEAGALQGERGSYRLSTPIDRLRVPGTVQAVLGARIDRLREREKQVLQTGSVIGKIFPERVIEKIAELPATDLSDSLRQLVAAEFVFEEALYPEAEYAFKHPLTQEVAYQSQLGARRARVHAATARVIEELYPEKLDEQAGLLAHHCEQAGEHFEAARWHRRAAIWSGASDAIECYRHWQQARILLLDHADTPEAEELLLEASIELLNLAWRVGLPGEAAEELFEQCQKVVASLGDKSLETKLLGSYGGMVGIVQGRAGAYYDVAKRSAEAAEASGDRFLQDSVSIYRSYSCLVSGRLEEAREVLETVLANDPADGQVHMSFLALDPYAFAWHNLTTTATELGDLDRARSANARAIERAQALGEFEIEIWALGASGVIGYAAGEPGNGPSQARRAVELAENVGSPTNRILAYMQLAASNVGAEDWRDADAAADQAIQTIRTAKVGRIWEPQTLAYWSEALLGAGDAALALERADESIAAALRNESPGIESYGQVARARALLALQGVAAAAEIERTLDRAVLLVEQTATGNRRPHVHECRAELAGLQGNATLREAELREARRLCEEMGAAGLVARIDAALNA